LKHRQYIGKNRVAIVDGGLVQKYIVHSEMKTKVENGSAAMDQTSWTKPCTIPRCLILRVPEEPKRSVFITLANEPRGAGIDRRRRLPRRKKDLER